MQIIITIIICGVDFSKVELDYDVFFVPEKINERNTHLIFQINLGDYISRATKNYNNISKHVSSSLII